MNTNDLIRELVKVNDVLDKASQHFDHEARMNAALHMSDAVRPAPLAVAVAGASDTLLNLIHRLSEEEATDGR